MVKGQGSFSLPVSLPNATILPLLQREAKAQRLASRLQRAKVALAGVQQELAASAVERDALQQQVGLGGGSRPPLGGWGEVMLCKKDSKHGQLLPSWQV